MVSNPGFGATLTLEASSSTQSLKLKLLRRNILICSSTWLMLPQLMERIANSEDIRNLATQSEPLNLPTHMKLT